MTATKAKAQGTKRAQVTTPTDRTLHIERPVPKHHDSRNAARDSARKQPFLQLLGEAQVDKLLTQARPLRFGRDT